MSIFLLFLVALVRIYAADPPVLFLPACALWSPPNGPSPHSRLDGEGTPRMKSGVFSDLPLDLSLRFQYKSCRSWGALSSGVSQAPRPTLALEIFLVSTFEWHTQKWKMSLFLVIFECLWRLSFGDCRAPFDLQLNMPWIWTAFRIIEKQGNYFFLSI